MKISVAQIQSALFTPISVIVHTTWFVFWLLCNFDINILTLIVSLEAIYITLFIGLEQKSMHDTVKTHKPELDKAKRNIIKHINK